MKLTAHPLAEPLPAGATTDAPTNRQLMLRLRLSLAQLLAKDHQLAATFYALLFERYPSIRALFPNDMKDQHSKLTQTLVWIVTHLEDRDRILPALRDLGMRHVAYGARPEHFPLVRDTLIEAMGRIAGPDWNAGLAEDWRVSIDLIARQMLAAATSTVRR